MNVLYWLNDDSRKKLHERRCKQLSAFLLLLLQDSGTYCACLGVALRTRPACSMALFTKSYPLCGDVVAQTMMTHRDTARTQHVATASNLSTHPLTSSFITSVKCLPTPRHLNGEIPGEVFDIWPQRHKQHFVIHNLWFVIVGRSTNYGFS